MLQSKTKFIAAVIYLASFCESQVTLDLCHPIIFGNFCQLRCETPDLTQDVVFRKDGTEYVSCKVAFGISQCLSKIGSGYTIAQSSSQPITYVNITQVSRAQDDGVWTCEYGPSARDSKNFTVFSEPSGVNTITGDTSLNYCNGNSTDSYITVQFTVPCCSEVDIKAVLANSAGDGLTRELVVSQGPACSDIKENTYSAEFNITKFELHNGPYSLSFKTQLTGNYGQEYETKSTSSYMFSCKKIDQCVCAVTTILGGVLGIPFTILIDAVFIFGIYIAKDKEIIIKCKEKKVLTIMAVCIGVLVSCGLGAGVTAAVMSGKDTGYESTGCKCMKYIGVVVSLGFSILVSVVTSAIIYLFVFSRKDAGTVCDGRKSPEGKEANNSVNENEMLPTKTDDDEKPSRQEDGNLQATPRDLPPIQKNESILATMPPRQLPLPPINHQVS